MRGEQDKVYYAGAFFSQTGRLPAEFELGECGCPVGLNCEHVVALVLSALGTGTSEPVRPSGPPPAVWESSLDSLLSPGRSARSGTTPLAIELTLAGGAGQPRWGKTAGPAPLRLSARLVQPGKNGGWVGGDMSWAGRDSCWTRPSTSRTASRRSTSAPAGSRPRSRSRSPARRWRTT